MASKLKAITTRAKQIYKKGKAGKTWIASIKEASKKISSGKKKKFGSVTASRKIKAYTKKAKVRLPHGYSTVSRKRLGTIAGHSSSLKNLIEDKIARLLIRRDLKVKKKSEKKEDQQRNFSIAKAMEEPINIYSLKKYNHGKKKKKSPDKPPPESFRN